VVATPDPVGLARLARGLVDLGERAPAASVRVVVNRMRPSLGWSEREIVGLVEGFGLLAGVHFLPDDRVSVDRALATGTSVPDVGDSGLASALAELADAVVPPAVTHRRRRRRRRVLRRRTAGTGRPR
jgi:hypothetical protein